MKHAISLVSVFILLALASPVTAQEATPQAFSSILAALGYPELHITAGDDGVKIPDHVNAGRTLIVYENVGQESFHPMMLRLPDAVSIDEAMADLGPEAMEPPAWFLEADFPGFVGETPAGQTSYALVDLTAGPHLVLHDSAAAIEVVAADATPAPARAPDVDGQVELFDMGFGFPGTIPARHQVWEVTNIGDVPHELLLLRSTKPLTSTILTELFMGEDENTTPVGGGTSLADIEPVGGVSWLSSGGTAWTEVDLEPGQYGALCFVYDPETSEPHLMRGMIGLFVVEEEATPAA